jgi:glycerol-3-phosphate cytidylyltransferase
MLKRASTYGRYLIVGVSTDALNKAKKGRLPVYTQEERLELVSAIQYVNEVFLEESLERKREYVTNHGADVLVMGDDWEGKFDDLRDVCKVVYLPRTPAISTTALIEKIRE